MRGIELSTHFDDKIAKSSSSLMLLCICLSKKRPHTCLALAALSTEQQEELQKLSPGWVSPAVCTPGEIRFCCGWMAQQENRDVLAPICILVDQSEVLYHSWQKYLELL